MEIYVYDDNLGQYRKITYGEVKQALLSDISVQGVNGYSTGAEVAYNNLPTGIIEETPQDTDYVTFNGEYCPLIINGLCHLGVSYKTSDDPVVNSPISSAFSAILQNEIKSDPLNRGYSSMSIEEQVTSLNTKDRPRKERYVTARTLLAELNPLIAATIYSKIKAGAESNAVLNMAMDMLTTYSSGGGIDICNKNTLLFVDSLVPDLLTLEEANSLKTLAYTSRAQELICRDVTTEDLAQN